MDANDYKNIEEYLKGRKIPKALKDAISVMLDKQAEDIVLLKLKGINDITDYMVICHGNSVKQNQAIADEIQRFLRKNFHFKPFSVEGEGPGDWILIDYIDFIIHIFSFEYREKYELEKLWMDAKRYNFYINK
jgi:ribosome-associated protein